MIAIDIPRRRIAFKAGLSFEEKFKLLSKAFYQPWMLPFYFPLTKTEIIHRCLPDVISFEIDRAYCG